RRGPPPATLSTHAATGIHGRAVSRQDCAPASTGGRVPPFYFSCPPGTPCTEAAVPLQRQLQNPVWLFPQDNNGMLVSLPSVPAGGAPPVARAVDVAGAPHTNNGLGRAPVLTADDRGQCHTITRLATHGASLLTLSLLPALT